jgi:hypothetical protein
MSSDTSPASRFRQLDAPIAGPAPRATREAGLAPPAWQVLPAGRPDAGPAVAGTIGKDHALERVDKYCIRIGQPDLDGNNIKIFVS